MNNSNMEITSNDNRAVVILQALKNRIEKTVYHRASRQALKVSASRIDSYLNEIKSLFTQEEIDKLLVIYATTARKSTLLGFKRFCQLRAGIREEDLNKKYNKHLKIAELDSMYLDLR